MFKLKSKSTPKVSRKNPNKKKKHLEQNQRTLKNQTTKQKPPSLLRPKSKGGLTKPTPYQDKGELDILYY